MELNRFSYLQDKKEDFLFCMICITTKKDRYENFLLQKKKIPDLVLYDAITPEEKHFNERCSKLNFHKILNNQKGRKALWLSNIDVFEYFLNSDYKYLVVLQDDAVVPKNIKDLLNKNYVNHPQFLDIGGCRLGQYASCNLYNKNSISKILDSIKIYKIDRGLDHYISNIPTGTKEERPFNFRCSLSNVSAITEVNPHISNNSMRLYYDKKY